ncbi:RagB/SusD family nutrient uptake outer membrane protein [Pedobacter faecalis]|uniref:RagB/SusD family nutrient uptake outer membrane protein n=1 Tax=Pedobacter faecalis TaxID=3041495 RepID=UPI00254A04FE|nr:RagB/SusD family nutrient uptake outer membrane protein [Pedobacter sp. ELA7]
MRTKLIVIKKWILLFTLSGLLVVSCKKFVEVNAPSTSTNSSIVYANDASATASITGIYTKMSQAGARVGVTGLSFLCGLSADELILFNGVTDVSLLAYYKNELTSINTSNSDVWLNTYPLIFNINAAIEGLESSLSLSPLVKQQLIGEAKFMRAFLYFYLTNLYGDVPLILSTDYKLNSNAPRVAQETVYRQVVLDLKDAESKLSTDYLNAQQKPVSDRTRPNKGSAQALLARVSIYVEDYVQAEKYASELINNKTTYDTVDVKSVFLKNTKETIWSLQPVDNFISNTSEGRLFILPSQGPSALDNPVYLNRDLVEDFSTIDRRLINWVGRAQVGMAEYFYPYKYKIKDPFAAVNEYSIVLRVAEQYLIRAEANLYLDRNEDAVRDLNVVRKRAGLPGMIFTSKEELLQAISAERRKELFSEWGHRWLDLKRLGLVNDILHARKGSTWQSTDELYPIPENDMRRNPGLVGNQNPGY